MREPPVCDEVADGWDHGCRVVVVAASEDFRRLNTGAVGQGSTARHI